MNNPINQPKLGFPVLVFLTPHTPLSLSFHLRIQYDAKLKQASFMLGTKVSAFVKGASDEHAFVAQYDADNLESNTLTSDKVRLQVPPTRLDELKRDSGTPEVIPLTLRLKVPCTIWRPRLDALVPAAEPSAGALFNELVQLSKATSVRIAVNRKWLTDEHRSLLEVINSASEAFNGYPVARYYSNFFDKADWTIFGPESPIKRPRDVSAPSSPPDYKRANSSKSPILDPIPSPTEVASSPSRSHIARFFSLFPPGGEDDDNFQSQAINRAVERRLHERLPQLLPAVIKQHLPNLLALPKDFPPYNSDIDTPSPPNPDIMPYSRDLTPLGRALMPFILDHLQPQVQNIISNSLNRGVDSRKKQAVLELGQEAEDEVASMRQEKVSIMDELAKERIKLMDDLRHEGKARFNELQKETDRGMDELEAQRDQGMSDLKQETIDSVEVLQRERDDGVDGLTRHSEEVLDGLKGDAAGVWADLEARINDNANAIVDACVSARANTIVEGHLQDRTTAIVATARKQLHRLKKEAVDEARKGMRGEKIFPRGQRPGRRAGKGGYYAIGHRRFS